MMSRSLDVASKQAPTTAWQRQAGTFAGAAPVWPKPLPTLPSRNLRCAVTRPDAAILGSGDHHAPALHEHPAFSMVPPP
jgi:hypothetical protein